MLRSYLLLTALFVVCTFSFVTAATYSPFSINAQKTQALSINVNNNRIPVVVLDVNVKELLLLKNTKQSRISIVIPVAENISKELHLEQFELFDDDATLVVETDNGQQAIQRPEALLLRGKIAGAENSFAYFSIVNEQLYAIVDDRQFSYVIVPQKDSENKNYIIYREEDLASVRPPLDCDSDELGIPEHIRQLQRDSRMQFGEISKVGRRVFVAVESDYEYYKACNYSVDSATTYLTTLFGTVASIYDEEVDVDVRISYLRIWATAKDPWGGKTTSKALSELLKFYNNYMGGVKRTIAHLISGKAIGASSYGGLAYVDVLDASANEFAYGVSQIQKNYQPYPIYSWDVSVVTHEIGHNFGSKHTHNCVWNPPIDSCYKIEGSCYTGPTVPRIGTIMSYCHLNSSSTLTFGTRVKNYLAAHAESIAALNSNFYTSSFRTFPADSLASLATAVTAGSGMPNAANVIAGIFNSKTLPAGIVVGIEQPKATQKVYGWLVISKAKTLKTFFPQTGTPRGFDFVKAKKDPKSAKYNNKFAAEVLTAKFNMIASLQGVFPGGFPFLEYRQSGHPMHEKRVYEIVSKADSILSYPSGVDTGTYTMLDTTLRRVNAAFIGEIDTTSFATKLRLKGVRTAATVGFLRVDSNGILMPQFTARMSPAIPEERTLLSNYPNPFNPTTAIGFSLLAFGNVTLKIYNVVGEEVATLLHDAPLEEGEHEIEFNASSLPSGIYFARLVTNEYSVTNKIVLMK
ncbi:MAG: zinc-dependent metalloprotease [Bacteroidota bacterium]